ncbi:uncharacterized protein LOC144707886 [Wolffia australiana]
MAQKLRSKYIPRQYQMSLFLSWLDLKQGRLVVTEYIEAFEECWMRCCFVEDPRIIIGLFADGLRPALHSKVLECQPAKVDEAYHLVEHMDPPADDTPTPSANTAPRTHPSGPFPLGQGTTPVTSVGSAPLARAATSDLPARSITVSQAHVTCYKCEGRGHRANQCLSSAFLIDAGDVDPDHIDGVDTPQKNHYHGDEEYSLEYEELDGQTYIKINSKACKLIMDSGSCINAISDTMVTRLVLAVIEHPTPYDVSWIDASSLPVKHQCRVPLKVSAYDEDVLCDVLPMKVGSVILGRPWLRSTDEHLDHLRQVCTVLRRKQLYAHPKKCSFLTSKVAFLEFIVSAQGIVVDSEKGIRIGGVLSQEGRPVEFFSEKLNDAKLCYSTYDKEFYTVLKYLHSQQKLSNRHARWVKYLQAYTFVIKHKKEFETVRDGYDSYLDLSSIIAEVRRGPSQDYRDFVITDGYLFYKNRLCVPRTSLCDFLTWECHAKGLRGHFGRDKTIAAKEYQF